MQRDKTDISSIVEKIGNLVPTFGGGRDSDTDPLAHAFKDQALMFAAGVDVRTVVEFVVGETTAALRGR